VPISRIACQSAEMQNLSKVHQTDESSFADYSDWIKLLGH